MTSFRPNKEVETLKASLRDLRVDIVAEETGKLYEKKVLSLLPPASFASGSERLRLLQQSVTDITKEIQAFPVDLGDVAAHDNLQSQITALQNASKRLNDMKPGTYHHHEGNQPAVIDAANLKKAELQAARVDKSAVNGVILHDMVTTEVYKPSETHPLSSCEIIRKYLKTQGVEDADLWIQNPEQHKLTTMGQSWQYIEPTNNKFDGEKVFQYVDSSKFPNQYTVILRNTFNNGNDRDDPQAIGFPNPARTLQEHITELWHGLIPTDANVINGSHHKQDLLHEIFDKTLCPAKSNQICVHVTPMGSWGKFWKAFRDNFCSCC